MFNYSVSFSAAYISCNEPFFATQLHTFRVIFFHGQSKNKMKMEMLNLKSTVCALRLNSSFPFCCWIFDIVRFAKRQTHDAISRYQLRLNKHFVGHLDYSYNLFRSSYIVYQNIFDFCVATITVCEYFIIVTYKFLFIQKIFVYKATELWLVNVLLHIIGIVE